MRRRVSIAVVVVLGILIVAVPASAAPLVLGTESFTSTSTAPGAWTSGGNSAAPPCLTAATVSVPGSIPACASPDDVDGSGVLRLTNGYNQAGFALFNTPMATSQGITVEFDMFQWGGDGADGMALIFVDGAASPTTPGGLGRSLGYSSSSVPEAGIVGGYLGVGFDHYGNFSVPGSGSGGPGNQPNSIVLRGSEATDYEYLGAAPATGPLAFTFAPARFFALRHVVVTLSAAGKISVWIDYGSGLVLQMGDFDVTPTNGALPATLKVGFSGGTGGQYNLHEVRNAVFSAFAPNLTVSSSASPSVTLSDTADVSLVVTNSSTAGPTNAPISVTSTVAAGLTPVSAIGSGWACSIVANMVTCTRPGTGADALLAGASAPPIHLLVTRTVATVLPITLSATVTTADDSDVSDNDVAVQLSTLAFSGELLAPTGIDDRLLPFGLGLLLLGIVVSLVGPIRRLARRLLREAL